MGAEPDNIEQSTLIWHISIAMLSKRTWNIHLELYMYKFAIKLFLVLVLMPICAQAAQYQAGKHYEVLADAVRTSDPNKVEVVEIFSFSC